MRRDRTSPWQRRTLLTAGIATVPVLAIGALAADSGTTAEEFGARGDGVADDTVPVQQALDRGGTVRLDGRYLVRGLTIPRDGTRLTGGGEIIKAPGRNGVLLHIVANHCAVTIARLTGLNGRCIARASGTELVVERVVTGTIRVNRESRMPSGAPLAAPGILPGTMVIDTIAAEGGAGRYRLSAPHDFAARDVRFVDAPSFWWVNDLVRNEGHGNLIAVGTIDGAGGNAIANIGGRGLSIEKTVIRNAYANGIISAGHGADDLTIRDVIVDGTGTQNGILITASPDSAPLPSARIAGATIARVTCHNCGDTALEIGYHTTGARITDCALGPSANPPLLLRDSTDTVAERIRIVPPTPSAQNGDWCGVAIVPQHESPSWRYGARLIAISSAAPVKGALIRLGGSGVDIVDCKADGGGADASGAFVSLADDISDIRILGNVARGFRDGIQLNYGAHPVRLSRIEIRRNELADVAVGINAFEVRWRAGIVVDNRVIDASRADYLISVPAGAETLPPDQLRLTRPLGAQSARNRSIELYRL